MSTKTEGRKTALGNDKSGGSFRPNNAPLTENYSPPPVRNVIKPAPTPPPPPKKAA